MVFTGPFCCLVLTVLLAAAEARTPSMYVVRLHIPDVSGLLAPNLLCSRKNSSCAPTVDLHMCLSGSDLQPATNCWTTKVPFCSCL